MPRIRAFRGLRYNLAQVGSLSDVVTPPCDVIGPEEQQRLYDRSQYNFIRLELSQGQQEGDLYEEAASIFRKWVREGVLQHEGDPALYVYHQIFDYQGQTYTRRGLLTRVELVRFGEGNIYPHEETHSKAKEDRLKLTRACQANLSPIFGLYPDESNAAQNIAEEHVVGTACVEAHDDLGVIHRIWAITDTVVIGKVASAIEELPLFIADGHHRYETACNYRDEVAESREVGPDDPVNSVLAMVMSMNDPGLVVFPTHRLFRGVPELDSGELRARLQVAFDVEHAGDGLDAARDVWRQIEQLNDQGAMAFYTAKDQAWTLCLANQTTSERLQRILPAMSDDWRELGVSNLHALVVDQLLEAKGHPTPKYVHEISEVEETLASDSKREFPLAALVMPASVDDVRRISLNGERMPAKSTYFFPKLLSGLVVNLLDG